MDKPKNYKEILLFFSHSFSNGILSGDAVTCRMVASHILTTNLPIAVPVCRPVQWNLT